jgi:peroxiredoxin-like protein
MDNSYLYRATAYWVLDSRGIVSGEKIPQSIEFSAPPEFGGEAELWTPEHFFLSSIATCFVSTFRAIAEVSKFDTVALDVAVEGLLKKDEGGFRFAEVKIRPVLTVATDEERERGIRLLFKAERACLISRSLNSKITIEPVVQVSALTAVE